MFEVLPRLHPSSLLMLDTWPELWEVSGKNKNSIGCT